MRNLVKKHKANRDKYRMALIAVLCIIAILRSGLRDIYNLPSGNDTPNYYIIYNNISYSSWGSIFRYSYIFTDDYEHRDPGYPLFIKATQFVYNDFTFFMFLTATIFMIPFGMYVYRFVKSYAGIILVFLIFFALFSNILNSFMRQAVALGIVLFAFRYILSREWKKYLLFFFLAFIIHSSSIITAPLYFLSKLKNSRRWLTIVLLASPVLVYSARQLFYFVVTGSVYETYLNDTFANPVNFIMLIYLISIAPIVFYNNISKSENFQFLVGGVLGSLLILPIVFMGNTMLRISYYYVLSIIPVIPIVIDNLKDTKNVKTSIYFVLISLLSIYILRA